MTRAGSLLRSIASNWALLALNVVISLFLSPYVVNKLGSMWYGIWALTLQFTGYLFLLDFGVRESVIRYVSKYNARGRPGPLNAVLTTAVQVYVPITLGCCALTALCAWGMPYWFDLDPSVVDEVRWTTMLVGGSIAFTFVFNIFTGIQYGLQRFELANGIAIVFTLVRTAIIVWLLHTGHGIVGLSAVQFGSTVIGGIVGAFLALWLLRKAGLSFKLVTLGEKRRVALRKRVFGYGWYVLVNNIGQKLIFASGAIITATMLPIAAVTSYAIAGSLVDNLRSLVSMTATVFNPLASHLQALNRGNEVANVLRSGAKLAVLITIPVAVSFVIIGDQFIALWMGEEFRQPSGDVLLVLGLAQVVSAPHYIVSSVLYGISQHRVIALVRIGEAALNIVLSVLLAWRFGVVGVAMGMTIAHVVSVGIVLPLRARHVLKLRLSAYYNATIVRPALAIAPFAVALYWLRANYPPHGLWALFTQIAALMALYAPSVYLLGLDDDERSIVRRLISRRAAPATTSA
jgi:O-antigen/teichoic acid export membrane protein